MAGNFSELNGARHGENPLSSVDVPTFPTVFDYGRGTVMAIKLRYNWLFLWDYTFCKWGYKML